MAQGLDQPQYDPTGSPLPVKEKSAETRENADVGALDPPAVASPDSFRAVLHARLAAQGLSAEEIAAIETAAGQVVDEADTAFSGDNLKDLRERLGDERVDEPLVESFADPLTETFVGGLLLADLPDDDRRKDATLNLRIASEDLTRVKQAAARAGFSHYQTWVRAVLLGAARNG